MRFAITAMSGVAAVLLASTAPASAQDTNKDTLKIGLVMSPSASRRNWWCATRSTSSRASC
jgi:hypothetical protein